MTSGVKGPVGLFQYTNGPEDADIVLVGEAWGSEEKHRERPFVGQSGAELDRILADAGLDRARILCTNIVNLQPPGNDLSFYFETGGATVAGLRPGPIVIAGLDRLYQQLEAHPRKLVIAAGNYALWALTNNTSPGRNPGGNGRAAVPTGIMAYRGSQLWRITHALTDRTATAIPVLPIVHPAAILRQWALRAITVHDLHTRVPLALTDSWRPDPRLNLEYRPTFDQVLEWIESKVSGPSGPLVCDIETKANTIITCIGFADSATHAIVIPFVNLGATRHDPLKAYWTTQEEISINLALCRLFAAPHISWIGQNFLYDQQYIQDWYGLVPALSHDTMLAQNLLLPGTVKDLGYLSSVYCKHHVYWKDDSREWTTRGTLDQHLEYNAMDVVRTYEIAERQKEVLAATGLAAKWPKELFKYNLAWRMMKRGLKVDAKARQSVALQLIERVADLEYRLLQAIPQATVVGVLNVKSTKLWMHSSTQTKALLYDVWGLKPQFDKKTKQPTTGKEAMLALSRQYPRLAGLFAGIAELRSISTLYSTFVSSKLEPDGRMRGSFNPGGTETFRWSSSQNGFGRGMNMQNIPAGGEDID